MSVRVLSEQLVSNSCIFSGMSAYIASPQKPWILDSGASSNMTGIKQNFILLNIFNKFSLINIVDGTQSHVSDNESSSYSILNSYRCPICSQISC